MSKVSFYVACLTLSGNVLELPVVRFETAVYRNATNNDTMFIGLLQSENNCLSRKDRFCKSFKPLLSVVEASAKLLP